MSEQPLVLIGARNVRRGREIESLLGRDGRLAVLGVQTRIESLIRALGSVRTASVVLDTELEDASGLRALTELMLARPTAAVCLTLPVAGQLSMELLRAGAIDALVWDGSAELGTAAANAVLAAAATPLDTIARVSPPILPSAASHLTGGPAHTLIALIGTRRGALAVDASLHLPAALSAAVLCSRPVHRSARSALASALDRVSPMRVRESPVASVETGTIYLFGDRDRIESSGTGLRIVHGEPTGSFGPENADDWLTHFARAAAELRTLVISAGHIEPATISTLSRMLNSGVSLARAVEGGYQVRWAHVADASRLAPAAFWEHVGTEVGTVGEVA